MKKILAFVLCAAMLLALCACGSSSMTSTYSETYNGITMTTTTVTSGDKTTTEVTYTDANGKAMSAEEGAAAFAAAKAEIENTVSEIAEEPDEDAEESVSASDSMVSKTTDTSTVTKAASDNLIEATLKVRNCLEDEDITEMYLSFTENTSWGENMLDEDGLGAGYTITFGAHMFYTADSTFDMKVVLDDGTELTFENFDMSRCADPKNIILDVDVSADGFYTLYFE